MALESIATIASLLEICALTINGSNALLLVELGEGFAEETGRSEMIWHLWTADPQSGEYKRSCEWRCFLPMPTQIAAQQRNSELYGLAETNDPNALLLVKFPFPRSAIQGDSMSEVAAIDLAKPVDLPLERTWPVPLGRLQPGYWLFDPSLFVGSSGEAVVCAVATDVSTRMFVVAEGKGASQVGAFESYAFPSYHEVKGARVLLAQPVPGDWRVNKQWRYRAIPSRLLPIHVIRLDNTHKRLKTISISDGEVTGPSFIFRACVADGERIVLATVGNVVKKPVLQVLVSVDAGESWTDKGTIAIPEMPRRLSVAAHGDEAIVLLTSNLSRVELARFSID